MVTRTDKTNRWAQNLSRDTGIPVGHFVPPGSIEAQERAGQQELVNSSVLPTELRNPQSEFEALGFVFGPVVSDDPLFQQVTLPPGWKKVGSNHDMWSYVEDERGIQRVAVFYKAAFYDRQAFMSIQSVAGGYAGFADYEGVNILDKTPWDVLTDQEKTDYYQLLIKQRADGQQYIDDANNPGQPWDERQRQYFRSRGEEKCAKIDAIFTEMVSRGWTNPGL